MKNKLQKLVLFFAAIIGLTASQKAFASHLKSAEITYVQVAPFSYNVTVNLYRDCDNVLPPSATSIGVRSPGCNNGRTVALIYTGTAPVGDQTCAQAGGCPTFKEIYTANVTFSISERSCPDWIFSLTECCRSGQGNLTNPQSSDFYTEAYVRIGQNLQNSSPVIGALEDPLTRFEFGTEAIYSLGTNDSDCDSLSYELVAPLTGPNTPVGYRPNPQTLSPGALISHLCQKFPYGPFNGQYAVVPTTFPANLSPTYPMPSLLVDWNSRPTVYYPGAPFKDSIWAATNAFLLDPVTGTLRFAPSYFSPSVPVGFNSYAIDVLISEWRNLNGFVTRVGYTRRSMVFTVVRNNILNLELNNVTLNGHPIEPGQIITIRPGMAMNLQLNAWDCGTNDTLMLSSNAAAILPGAVFTSTTGPNATATGSLTWSGNLSCDRPVFFQVKLENTACPFKGFQTHTFGVRVSTTARVTGQKEAIASNAGFMAFPNPFSSQVAFSFKTVTAKPQQILIYNGVGQLVDQLELKAAQQEITWEKAAGLGNGLYIARLVQNGQAVQTIRFTKAN